MSLAYFNAWPHFQTEAKVTQTPPFDEGGVGGGRRPPYKKDRGDHRKF